MENISVLIVDDHTIVRDGLKAVFAQKDGYQVIGEASNGLEALDRINRNAPDIVLLDVHMPELSGLDIIGKIKVLAPNTRIVILTMYDRGKYVAAALRSGASAYVLKDAGINEIFQAIEAALKNETFLSKRINQIVVREFARTSTSANYVSCVDALSDREREVFQLVISGRTTKEIASRLSISPKTVEHHRSNIMQKLECPSVHQLLLLAVREGYLLE